MILMQIHSGLSNRRTWEMCRTTREESQKQWKHCNGELGTKLAAIVVAVTLMAKQWNASMWQYKHLHWQPIRLRNHNALCKSYWMLCIFCSWGYRGACFQSGPSVRPHSVYCDILTEILRKCDSANAFWTRYLENMIGWPFRIVQKNPPKWITWRFC